MTGIAIITALAALGIDYGWQPVAGGGIEYIIQLEPAALDALRSGEDIFSDLPADLSGIRSYRITTGSGPLPHHGEPPPVPRELPPSGTAAGAVSRTRLPQAIEAPHTDPMLQLAGGSNTTVSPAHTAPPVPAATKIPPAASTTTTEPEKPWMTLTMVLLALFASLGANAYLGILGYGLHRRCRDLLGQLKMSP